MNTVENDHVEIHEIDGFAGQNLEEAFQETYAISRATKCKQFLFSVSLNPPDNAKVPTQAFVDAADRIGEELNLQGQPRAIAFHEKNGRRHAHCVWSRIDAENLKAINLPFYKSKLREVSRELFLEHGWNLPNGLIDRELRNPLNFTLEEWQQAKRMNDDPRRIKLALRECWAISDSRQAFESALERKGYYLARGDRRGYVAVDWRGEVYSLSRATCVKAKELESRLGPASEFLSVADAKAAIDQDTLRQKEAFTAEIYKKYQQDLKALALLRRNLTKKHQRERDSLRKNQEIRRLDEAHQVQAQLRGGVLGWLDGLSGRRARIQSENQRQAWACAQRDQKERDDLIYEHLEHNRSLNDDEKTLQASRANELDLVEIQYGSQSAPRPKEQQERGKLHSQALSL